MAHPSAKKFTAKQRMTLVYLAMGIILIASIIGKIYHGKDSFSLDEVLANKVATIIIKDQGFVATNQISISNADSVNQFINLVKQSKPVDFQSLRIRIGAPTCEIIFKTTAGTVYSTVLTDESKDKGVLRSGEFFYRNDELLKQIENKLRVIQHSVSH